MYWLLLLLLCFGPSCAAVCVRDTDCLGTSVCEDNRCLLIVKGDAGRSSPGGASQTENPSSSQSDEPSESTSDGGSFSASADAGN
jgi:hypothetical protein